MLYINVMPACRSFYLLAMADKYGINFAGIWILIWNFSQENFFSIYWNLLICNISASIASNSKIVTTLPFNV